MSWGKGMDRRTGATLPGYTCPQIDEAIELLEAIRKANEKLRDAAKYNDGQLDEAEDEIQTLKDEIADLKKDLGEMAYQLGIAQDEIKALRCEVPL